MDQPAWWSRHPGRGRVSYERTPGGESTHQIRSPAIATWTAQAQRCRSENNRGCTPARNPWRRQRTGRSRLSDRQWRKPLSWIGRKGRKGCLVRGGRATTYVPACASLVMGSGSPIGSSPFVELLKNGVSGWPKLQSASKGVSGAIKPKLTEASAQLAPLPQVATPVATTRTGTLVMDLGGSRRVSVRPRPGTGSQRLARCQGKVVG